MLLVKVGHSGGRLENTHSPLLMAQPEQVLHASGNTRIHGVSASLRGVSGRDPSHGSTVLALTVI